VAFLNGTPAGIGSLARNESVGYFHGTAVLPEFQGNGVYRALVEHRLKALHESKAKLAATVALPTSAPRLERFGFRKAWTAEVFLKSN
jgi:predicted N-acetyltransferase YhbS